MSFVNDYSLPLVTGISIGSIYGLAAMGLVLTYKTSALFNFGQGAVAAAGAYVFYGFFSKNELDLPWPLAAAIAILVFGPVTGLVLERVARGLAGVSTTYRIVGTIGLLLFFRQLGIIVYDNDNSLQLGVFLPHGAAFTVGQTVVGYDQIITVLVALGAAVGLYAFFRRSRTGTAMRGVVDDADLLDMTGTSPARVRRTAWVIGTCFASMSGVLIAPQQNAVDGSLLTILVVQAFGAAVIGLFRSLPLVYVGGLAVGILQGLVNKWVADSPDLSQLGPNVPFLVLFLGLLVIPRGRLVEIGRHVKARTLGESTLSGPTRGGLALVTVVLLCVVPQVVGTKLTFWTEGVTQIVMFLALGLLVRTSGQVSLCHVGLAAVGAVVFSKIATEQGLPWGVAVLLAGLCTVPVGAIIAIPAIRLSGLYLGLATLGFGVLLAQVFYLQTWMFGPFNGIPAPRPHVFGMEKDKGYYYAVLIVAALCAAVVLMVERSRLGRLLRGLADSPTALTTHGVNVNVTRVIVFCISAFLAGVSGAIFAPIFQHIDQNSFNFFNSLILLAVLAISSTFLRTVPAALLAAVLYEVVPGYIDDQEFNRVLPLLFGVGALLAALVSQSAGPSAFFHRLVRVSRWRSNSPVAARTRARTELQPVP